MVYTTDAAGYDYVIIGSGFGGSVAAMRLTEKGYSVLVLERGKRFQDQDFPKTNWNIYKYLWLPALRCFGIFVDGAGSDTYSESWAGNSLMWLGPQKDPDNPSEATLGVGIDR